MGLPQSPRRGHKREPAPQQADLHVWDICRTATGKVWAHFCCSTPGPISRIVSSTSILKVNLCSKTCRQHLRTGLSDSSPRAGGTWTVVAQRIPLAASPGTTAAVRSSASTQAAPESTAAVQPGARQRPVHGATAHGLELQLLTCHVTAAQLCRRYCTTGHVSSHQQAHSNVSRQQQHVWELCRSRLLRASACAAMPAVLNYSPLAAWKPPKPSDKIATAAHAHHLATASHHLNRPDGAGA